MPIKVLVVDDSAFFRKRIVDIFNKHNNISVVGVAENGVEAIAQAKILEPDAITMDYEMPVMDGVSAIEQIMKDKPLPILMFSSLTYEGATITLSALQAGATDFLSKTLDTVDHGDSHNQILCEKLCDTVKNWKDSNFHKKKFNKQIENNSYRKRLNINPDVVLIGASTGGPLAIKAILEHLPEKFSVPIVVVQHMPASFTLAFSDRLNSMCKLSIKHAENGDVLKPGFVYVAPGGHQLIFDKRKKGCLSVLGADDRVQYQPCLDITFASAARVFPGKVLAIVLTGMGSDGKDGAQILKKTASVVWTQDPDSCVIYGMPMVVKEAQLSDAEVKLSDMSNMLIEEVGSGYS